MCATPMHLYARETTTISFFLSYAVLGNPISPLSKQFYWIVIDTLNAMLKFLNLQVVPNNVFQPKSNVYKNYIRILTENIGTIFLFERHSK